MISFEGERAEFDVDIPDTCLNPLGTVQGGMVASILDEATSVSYTHLTLPTIYSV